MAGIAGTTSKNRRAVEALLLSYIQGALPSSLLQQAGNQVRPLAEQKNRPDS